MSFAGEKDLDGRSLVNEIAGDINIMLKRKIKAVKVVYLLNFFRIISENTRPNEMKFCRIIVNMVYDFHSNQKFKLHLMNKRDSNFVILIIINSFLPQA